MFGLFCMWTKRFNNTAQKDKTKMWCVNPSWQKLLIIQTHKVQVHLFTTKQLILKWRHLQRNLKGDMSKSHPTIQMKFRRLKLESVHFINQNSYENCTDILRKIGEEARIECYGGKKQQWVITECDGLLFWLCFNFLNDAYTCSIWNTSH